MTVTVPSSAITNPEVLIEKGKHREVQPSRRGRRWLPLVWMLVLLLIGSIAWFLTGLLPGGSVVLTSSKKTATFTVGALPQLVVHNDVGTTHIAGSSSGNDVTITEGQWTTVGVNLNDIRVSSVESADGKTLTVTVERLKGTTDSIATGVNLDITVPHNTDLRLVATRGSIEVTGVIGRMMLKSNTGSIQVTASILTGNSILATKTGSIYFNGTSVAKDTHGTCTYQFLTEFGPIRITLPGNSAFDLDASNRTGAIESNVPGMTKRLGPTQFEAHGSLGNPPRAHVIVKSTMGLIQLNVVLILP